MNDIQPDEGVDDAQPRVRAAARAVEILLAVAHHRNGLTAQGIADEVGLTKQTTYHLLHTLVGCGMLMRADRRHYILGIRAGSLAQGFLNQLSPSIHLQPIVRRLAEETTELAYAAGWQAGEIATIAVVSGTNSVQAAPVAQGYLGNAHARAAGKLLLAVASPSVCQEYLDSHELVRLTPHTIVEREQLMAQLEQVREQGYATDEEEFAEGVCCMAVHLDNGHSPFVLAISAPRDRFFDRFEKNLEIARHIANSAVTKA